MKPRRDCTSDLNWSRSYVALRLHHYGNIDHNAEINTSNNAASEAIRNEYRLLDAFKTYLYFVPAKFSGKVVELYLYSVAFQGLHIEDSAIRSSLTLVPGKVIEKI